MSLSQMTDQIGRVLGSRYRLTAPLGSGTAAQVYLADDVRLHRQVAVKVLHPGLADDQTFLRRFRAEALASAKLNHSHIVKLLDQGDDGGPYLVTEYLEGGSLRALLDQGHRLSVAQAAQVGLQAAKGLDVAHRQGFVHRDIKPANLLFGADGRLRIADFGVARALAEAAWTEPSGAVLGTVRYASPEQANGEPATGKSDVYALALVLIECVTGAVPFATDTTASTLRARVDAVLEVGPELGPLAEALEWAGRPDPSERPDAAQPRDALADVVAALDPPEPLPLAGALPTEDSVVFVDPDPTHLPPAGDDLVVLPDEAAAPVAPRTGLVVRAKGALEGRRRSAESGARRAADGDGAHAGTTTAGTATAHAAGAAAATGEAPAVEAGASAGARRSRRSTALLVAGGLAVAVVAVFGVLALRELLRPRHEVPELVGQDVAELAAAVEGNGWDVERVQVRQDGTREGEIVAQDPAPGEQLREGHTLTVTVSRGAELVPVPTNLAGLEQDEAAAALAAVGLQPGALSEKWGELVPAGVVLGDSLLYDEVPAGSRVPLVVSKGPRPRTIPEGLAAAGLSYEDVAARLREVQPVPVAGEDYSETVPEGEVIGTSPAGGSQVPRDSEVVVLVSLGPQPIVIPDVSGDSVAAAQSALEAAGLVVDGVQGPPNGVVTGTDPAAGLTVDRGTSIVLITQRRGSTNGNGQD